MLTKHQKGVCRIRQVTLAELKQLALEGKNSLWEQARSEGRDVKIYVHWSAGHYGSFFDDYHVNVDKDGSIYVSTDDLSTVLAHTYCRNTGAIGIAAACCVGSSLDGDGTSHLGPEPPTDEQIEAIAQVICVLADALDLTIDLNRVLTHAEAGDNKDGLSTHEPYGPDATCERWDFFVCKEGEEPYSGGDTLRGKANYYRGQGLLA